MFKHTQTDPHEVARTGLYLTIAVLAVAVVIALFM